MRSNFFSSVKFNGLLIYCLTFVRRRHQCRRNLIRQSGCRPNPAFNSNDCWGETRQNDQRMAGGGDRVRLGAITCLGGLARLVVLASAARGISKSTHDHQSGRRFPAPSRLATGQPFNTSLAGLASRIDSNHDAIRCPSLISDGVLVRGNPPVRSGQAGQDRGSDTACRPGRRFPRPAFR